VVVFVAFVATAIVTLEAVAADTLTPPLEPAKDVVTLRGIFSAETKQATLKSSKSFCK